MPIQPNVTSRAATHGAILRNVKCPEPEAFSPDRCSLVTWYFIRSTGGLLDETRYVLNDYLDPVALIDSGGTVTERFRYDAFGTASILAPDFTPRAASECDWTFLYHAEFIDTATGLFNYGYRFYHPGLGRWLSRDPIGEEGGLNLYGFVGNFNMDSHDYFGLKVKESDKCTKGQVKWIKFCVILAFGSASNSSKYCTDAPGEKFLDTLKDAAKGKIQKELDDATKGSDLGKVKEAVGKIIKKYSKIGDAANAIAVRGNFGLSLMAVWQCCKCDDSTPPVWRWGENDEDTQALGGDGSGTGEINYNLLDPKTFSSFEGDYLDAIDELAESVKESCGLSSDS